MRFGRYQIYRSISKRRDHFSGSNWGDVWKEKWVGLLHTDWHRIIWTSLLL